jgi:hypothetical protein
MSCSRPACSGTPREAPGIAAGLSSGDTIVFSLSIRSSTHVPVSKLAKDR